MTETNPKLSFPDIVAILHRHKGSITEIADELGIRHSGVSQWLVGRTTSARIAEAAERKAQELLKLENNKNARSAG